MQTLHKFSVATMSISKLQNSSTVSPPAISHRHSGIFPGNSLSRVNPFTPSVRAFTLLTIFMGDNERFLASGTLVIVHHITPASAISGIHAPSPRAWCVYTRYCTSGGVIWYLFHTSAILRTRCSAARSRSIELAS